MYVCFSFKKRPLIIPQSQKSHKRNFSHFNYKCPRFLNDSASSHTFPRNVRLTRRQLISWVGGIPACQQEKPFTQNDQLQALLHHLKNNLGHTGDVSFASEITIITLSKKPSLIPKWIMMQVVPVKSHYL